MRLCHLFYMLIVCFRMRNRHKKCRLRLKLTFSRRASSILHRKPYDAIHFFSLSHSHRIRSNFDFWKVHFARLFIVFFSLSLSMHQFLFLLLFFLSLSCVSCLSEEKKEKEKPTTTYKQLRCFLLFLSFFSLLYHLYVHNIKGKIVDKYYIYIHSIPFHAFINCECNTVLHVCFIICAKHFDPSFPFILSFFLSFYLSLAPFVLLFCSAAQYPFWYNKRKNKTKQHRHRCSKCGGGGGEMLNWQYTPFTI